MLVITYIYIYTESTHEFKIAEASSPTSSHCSKKLLLISFENLMQVGAFNSIPVMVLSGIVCSLFDDVFLSRMNYTPEDPHYKYIS